MKLRTVMCNGRLIALPRPYDRRNPVLGPDPEFIQDAAAAHALTQAIAEWRKFGGLYSTEESCDWIRERADEIMREFGLEVK
jgi:hypothetical protein